MSQKLNNKFLNKPQLIRSQITQLLKFRVLDRCQNRQKTKQKYESQVINKIICIFEEK